MRTTSAAAATAAVLLLAALSSDAAFAQNPPRTIDVTGHADVKAKPDTMIVSFPVSTEAPTSDKCAALQSEKSSKVVDALKRVLGDDAKIETSDFGLNLKYRIEGPATPTPEIQRWVFDSFVTAYADSMVQVGDLIDRALAAGATGVERTSMESPPRSADQPASQGQVFRAPALGAPILVPQPLPEVPTVTMRTTVEGASASDATRRGAEATDRVVAALRGALKDKNRVTVSNFTVTPQQPPNTSQNLYVPPPRQVLDGYQAHVTVTAETRKLDLLGRAIESAMAAGASQLNSVSFTLREDADARKDALAKASGEARSKAETVANSMGVKLGKVLRISTNAQVHPMVVSGASFGTGIGAASGFAAGGVARAPAAPTLPVMPHEVPFSADVSAVYEIQ